jgi:hypothetical protein
MEEAGGSNPPEPIADGKSWASMVLDGKINIPDVLIPKNEHRIF